MQNSKGPAVHPTPGKAVAPESAQAVHVLRSTGAVPTGSGVGRRVALTPGQPAVAKPKVDGRKRFAPGDVMFEQGSPGGDLFFIEEGTVEIFTKKDNEEILLAEMGSGEIIGVMTCMTKEPRMANARARTAVVCKRVPHEAIAKTIAALPNWMKIVLKEFTIRLMQMNRIYSEAFLKIKKLESSQLSSPFLGALLASSFVGLAEFMSAEVDGESFVVVEPVLAKLEKMLGMRKTDIDRLWGVFCESGLIRPELEPDKKRHVVNAGSLQALESFADFVKDAQHGAGRKLVKAHFTGKETRVLAALVKLAARLDMDLKKQCRLLVAELEKTFERSTGTKFDRPALDKPAALGLLQIEGDSEDECLVFMPHELGRIVACLEVMRRLMIADGSYADEASAKAS